MESSDVRASLVGVPRKEEIEAAIRALSSGDDSALLRGMLGVTLRSVAFRQLIPAHGPCVALVWHDLFVSTAATVRAQARQALAELRSAQGSANVVRMRHAYAAVAFARTLEIEREARRSQREARAWADGLVAVFDETVGRITAELTRRRVKAEAHLARQEAGSEGED